MMNKYLFETCLRYYVYWTEHHLDSWVKRDQLDFTCFIISLFNAQHVSDVNTSILRSLRLICWVISWLCIDLVRCVLVLRCGMAGVVWYPYAGWSLHTDTMVCGGMNLPSAPLLSLREVVLLFFLIPQCHQELKKPGPRWAWYCKSRLKGTNIALLSKIFQHHWAPCPKLKHSFCSM